ncbi:hypothetical protein [Burkholderia sp. Ac-20365]|uniref:hypothetical protein n=1 Tax=Burkholderia sp. Ac-20365 TaxID=2703897 RepID=UPI00197B132A|nr:hypothetical protein [Burkholderia sp. Ac-20365]MBN3761374.1 hypothetical protein [Burkholderia sp. Ac-20365]
MNLQQEAVDSPSGRETPTTGDTREATESLRVALRAAGYCRCPNNIHSLPGTIWYAGGPGIPEPKGLQEVYLHEGKISVITHRFVGIQYVRGHYEQDEVASFDAVDKFIDWCREHGKISEPGLPAFSNSWD